MELANIKQTVFWTDFVCAPGHLIIAATSQGLCYVGSPNGRVEDLFGWTEKHIPNHQLVRDPVVMNDYVRQFDEYFQGRRSTFTFPLAFYGTAFQTSVWAALQQIPYGRSRSYTDVAISMQRPKSVRAIAAAIGANPLLIAVPCHRVIGKSGALTGYRGGLDMKAWLLTLEGKE
ncbi:methylated-DNA--[protein]-cysteine S-methyltransferase [Alicyclobacillus fastidiosus]|uniref:Methylated-DNA--protein-cysteine methyltransferase n=1 Tax=Alicyclobacillus fastidiosus TaxID=392011 RepID=A0ABY6ZIG5_9BACL|nr:methylated-DNA--[protein]-cysteine S-methyltransferase [Alicyclobacillus fastidiosus]WAH42565.1 methylated-DNA--[protein]-cysteine S-methyltransferase [Alicyclobacillus fastidiosus]GMA64418.1 methylated-DNA--[protein]-cysteine S-methyltransferase [Alicyclobacillus fastidiosus]